MRVEERQVHPPARYLIRICCTHTLSEEDPLTMRRRRRDDEVMTGDAINQVIDDMAATLGRLPVEHLAILQHVPIILTRRFPHGAASGGGWFPPGPPVRRWLTPAGIAYTEIELEEIEDLRPTHGIIGVSRAGLVNPTRIAGTSLAVYNYTLLHETGHCIDYHANARHGGLVSPPQDDGYRGGNAPYQGQRYRTATVDCTVRGAADRQCLSEKSANAYASLFLCPNRMCLGGEGTPPCVAHNPARCNYRMQRDLQRTDAFVGISEAMYFPALRAGEVVERGSQLTSAASDVSRPRPPGARAHRNRQ